MNTIYNIQDTYKYIIQILSTKNFWNIDNNVSLFLMLQDICLSKIVVIWKSGTIFPVALSLCLNSM